MLDLEAISARADAATPGPWIIGDRWHIAGVMPEMFGEGKCSLCRSENPIVWEGRRDINGKRMLAHVHQTAEPWYGEGHQMFSYDGGPEPFTVAGNYDWEVGGIISPVDCEFIAHAREDIPALIARIRELEATNV
jgi:hypothetical protein